MSGVQAPGLDDTVEKRHPSGKFHLACQVITVTQSQHLPLPSHQRAPILLTGSLVPTLRCPDLSLGAPLVTPHACPASD